MQIIYSITDLVQGRKICWQRKPKWPITEKKLFHIPMGILSNKMGPSHLPSLLLLLLSSLTSAAATGTTTDIIIRGSLWNVITRKTGKQLRLLQRNLKLIPISKD
jgi:hypothetical protein